MQKKAVFGRTGRTALLPFFGGLRVSGVYRNGQQHGPGNQNGGYGENGFRQRITEDDAN